MGFDRMMERDINKPRRNARRKSPQGTSITAVSAARAENGCLAKQAAALLLWMIPPPFCRPRTVGKNPADSFPLTADVEEASAAAGRIPVSSAASAARAEAILATTASRHFARFRSLETVLTMPTR